MILYRDDRWLVVDKPTGMATYAPRAGELGVVEWLALHLDEKVHVVSRLDRETSGVLLLARSPEASAAAQTIHEAGTATKIYEFFSAEDSSAAGRGLEWECDDDLDGKTARTRFQHLAAIEPSPAIRKRFRLSGPIHHYRAEINRGRRHQIRRHAAAGGVPLLGDTEYGGANWPRVCLHCAELGWPELSEPLTTALPPSYLELQSDRATVVDLGFALCLDRRGTWLPEITDAYRAVHRGEIPDLPVAVDIYGSWFNAVWFDEERSPDAAGDSLDLLLKRIAEQAECRGGVLRIHRRNPHQRTLVTETRTLGEAPPETFAVTEHGLRYEINLTGTQHTGLFLDQRDSRRWVARRSAGARLANLFAFTCSFSLVAAAAGAEVAFSVDVARPCLNTGKTNFEWNGLSDSGRGKFIQEDTRKWLDRQLRRRRERPEEFQPLDLVICDPPVFASSKDGGKFILEKEWPRLAQGSASLLTPGGAAVFANNHQSGDSRSYLKALEEAFASVVQQQAPLDFPTLNDRPPHVRIYFCSEPSRD